MSDSNLPVPQRYTRFAFAGSELIAVFRPDEGMAIPVRLVCEILGLDLNAQSRRLRKHAVLNKGLRKDRVPIGNRMIDIVVILHKYIPFWLASISPDQVAAEVQEQLILYQTELVDVLAAIYLRQTGQSATVEQRQITQFAEEIRHLLASQRDHEERLTLIEAVVDDLRQYIPVTPAQAEFLLRSLKRLGARTRGEPAGKSTTCSWRASRPSLAPNAMMRCQRPLTSTRWPGLKIGRGSISRTTTKLFLRNRGGCYDEHVCVDDRSADWPAAA